MYPAESTASIVPIPSNSEKSKAGSAGSVGSMGFGSSTSEELLKIMGSLILMYRRYSANDCDAKIEANAISKSRNFILVL